MSLLFFYKGVKMDNKLFGIKEIHNCIICPHDAITINGIEYNSDEPILSLETLDLVNFSELKNRKYATGGYKNQTWIYWEETPMVNLSFSHGVMSKTQMGLLGNSALISKQEEFFKYSLKKTVDEEGRIFLPDNIEVFIKDSYFYKNNGEKISNEEVEYNPEENYIKIKNQEGREETFFLVMSAKYKGTNSILEIGNRMLRSFVSITGIIQRKEEDTGKIKSIVLNIPKAQLSSNFVAQIGNDSPPMVANFEISAFPVGEKHSLKNIDFIFLDIDLLADY